MVTLRERKLISGKIQLYLDIYDKGKRATEALGIYLTGDRKKDKDLRATANAIRSKRELEFHNDKEGFTSAVKRKVDYFLFSKTVYDQKSENTRRTYINMLEYLEACVGPQITMEMITPKICEKFKNYLLSGASNKEVRGLRKINSAVTYYERFRTILRSAVDVGILKKNPSKGIFIRKEETLPKYLTKQQLQILAKTPIGNKDVKEAFFLACYTGLRYSDACNLKWGQVHGDGIHLVEKKTGAGHVIPLHKVAKNILNNRRGKSVRSGDLVFSFPRRSTVDKLLKRWAKRGNIDISLSFHKARHTFATLIYTETGDIYSTSKALGHKNLENTLIYAKVIDQKQKMAIDTLPKISGI